MINLNSRIVDYGISGFEREAIPKNEGIPINDLALPREIKIEILSHSDIPEMAKWSGVNKIWHQIVEESWKEIKDKIMVTRKQVKAEFNLGFLSYFNSSFFSGFNLGLFFMGQNFQKNLITEVKVRVPSFRIEDVNDLQILCQARNDLIVFETLTKRFPNAIGNPVNLDLNCFASIKEMIDAASGLEAWCIANQNDLANLDSLKLVNKGLTSLPVGIWKYLPALKSLKLYNNRLNDVPIQISHLKKLENIDLHSNRFTMFPKAICELNSLQNLDLSCNLLNCLNGIDQLTNLQEIKLSDNYLLTSLPVEIVKLTNVKILELAGTPILHTIPDWFKTSPLYNVTTDDGCNMV